MARIEIEALGKRFPDGTRALDDVSLDVADGELLVLVGPSGCGKSTLLRIVAGLDEASSGRVRIDGEDVTGRSPAERDLGMVFQSYALYPHKTVRQNLAFGLRMRRRPRAEIDARVAEVATALGLMELLDRRPGQLSGGQRQRVALGRAIARRARAFLLDEPLSNLDARLRHDMRAELSRLHRDMGATMLYVTHDQEEAMTLGSRIAVLRAGRVEQVGSPDEIYRFPRNTFVATFLGSPAMNLVPVQVVRAAGRLRITACELAVELPGEALDGQEGAALLGVRPQDVAPARGEPAHARARVELVQHLGAARLVLAQVGERAAPVPLTLLAPADADVTPGDVLPVRFATADLHVFDAASGARIAGGRLRTSDRSAGPAPAG